MEKIKLCSDCRYFHRDLWCKSPANGISLTDGKVSTRFASVARGQFNVAGYDNQCGPNGNNFLAKSNHSHEKVDDNVKEQIKSLSFFEKIKLLF